MKNFKVAVFELFEKILEKYKNHMFECPINAYITGGVAVHFYTKVRMSDDIDIILDRELDIPNDLFVEWLNENGEKEVLMYDYNYNDTFVLIPEEYKSRAKLVKNLDDKINIYVLHPLDLIISKISRYADNDIEDIENLIEQCDLEKFNITKENLLEIVFYEIDGRLMSNSTIKDHAYRLIDICELIDEKMVLLMRDLKIRLFNFHKIQLINKIFYWVDRNFIGY